MNTKPLAFFIAVFLMAVMLLSSGEVLAEEPKLFIPDKALCAKMIRFGKEAYQRGKYLDAKEYFRKAIQADPTSSMAWTSYDQAVIFALAEKVEKDANIILPDVSTKQELPNGSTSSGPTPPQKPAPSQKDTQFRIVDDEGC